MAAQFLARAARRLAGGGSRGLSEALSSPSLAGSGGRQAWQEPWMLTALRAHGVSGGSAEAAAGSAAAPSGSSSTDSPAAASTSSSSTAARSAVPEGHVDFEQRQLVMMFTCNVCETRAARAFSKQSYTSGVVIVECPGCSSRHLIADHLGWFGQKGTVEQFAAEKGGLVVSKLADGTLELTPGDILGASFPAGMAAAAHAAAAAAAEGAAAEGAAQAAGHQ